MKKGFYMNILNYYTYYITKKLTRKLMKKIQKKTKKKKLDSLPKIKRKLFKIWSLAVRERAGHKCEYCGIERGAIHINKKGASIKTKIDAHHLLSRDGKDCPLKFDILNSVAVCSSCHKFSFPSFHRDPITTIHWLRENRNERYEYVLKNASFKVDLDNRKVLEEIGNRINENLSLDLEKLKAIEEEFPRKKRVKVEPIKGNMFDEFSGEITI
jgi:hypothetical protein